MNSRPAELAWASVQRRTIVRKARATSPLRLLTPGNAGNASWVYMSTLGGGLVDGDRIDLSVHVDRGATGFLGTQSSTRVYANDNGCAQHLTATIEADALLVLAPDPLVCFDGSTYEQSVDVEVSTGGSLIVVDVISAGRVARGERWVFRRLKSGLHVRPREAHLPRILDDVTLLDQDHGRTVGRMGPFDALATVVAVGPRADSVCAALSPARVAGWDSDGIVAVASSLPSGPASLVRIAGRSLQQVLRVVRNAIYAPLVDILADDPWARKW